MADTPLFKRATALADVMGSLLRFQELMIAGYQTIGPGASDFTTGNPQEEAIPGYVDALQRSAVPENKNWYAYSFVPGSGGPEAPSIVAASLGEYLGIPFEPAGITMTNAGFGALAVAINALTDPGDEVIFSRPPWFFYELLVRGADAVPVKVDIDPETFDLDLAAIGAAITPRTRALIVNTPNNPTGKIYSPETLRRLATLLEDASGRNGRAIYVVSDEPYHRIVFDGRRFHSPAEYYPNTVITYSYGKVHLAPGQRLGWVALAPAMPDRDQVRQAIAVTQMALGSAVPNTLMLHALPDLVKLSIDIAHLQRKRDRMIAELRELGYQVHVPEGTFYLLPKSPWENDVAFVELLQEYGILVMPGTVCEVPGYFRISLTASDEMIDRALPRFAAAIEHARSTASPSAGNPDRR